MSQLGMVRKQVEGGVKKMAPAQTSDIELIQKHVPPGAEIAPEEVLVVNALLAHTRKDRSHEKFTKAYLDRFAETLPGKGLLIGHNYEHSPVGRWIDAEVRAAGNDHELHAKFYVKSTSDMAGDIRLGIAKDVSIGFIPDQRLCDLCGKDYESGYSSREGCQHQAGTEYDGKLCELTYGGDTRKVEALEGSLVWLGCQPGAGVTGNTSPVPRTKMAPAAVAQGDDMELKEALLEIERLKPLAEAGEKYKAQAEAYVASLTREAIRKTKAINFAATRDEKAAEKSAEFTGRLLKSASVSDLEAMNAELDEQLKSTLAPGAKTEGAEHVPGTKENERTATKRQPWEPRPGDF